VLKLASVLLLYHLASDSLSGRAAYLATSTSPCCLLWRLHLMLASYSWPSCLTRLNDGVVALLSTLLKSNPDLALRQPAASTNAAMSLLGKPKTKAKSNQPSRSEYRLVLYVDML
jgi:hypothetical protein